MHEMISQPFETSCLLGNAWVLPGTTEILALETSNQLHTFIDLIKYFKCLFLFYRDFSFIHFIEISGCKRCLGFNSPKFDCLKGSSCHLEVFIYLNGYIGK